MIAGLPNSFGKVAVFVLASIVVSVLALPLLAEGVQTPSTTLSDVLTLITQNQYLSSEQQTLLTSSLTAAVTSGALTADQALSLVNLSGLENINDATQAPLLTQALSIVLDALTSGDIDPDQASTYLTDAVTAGSLSALRDLTGIGTPTGIHTAISKFGSSENYDQDAIDEVLSKVDELVAADVPPGIALRVARALLRAGLPADEIIAQLDQLETSINEDGTSPGKAANEVTPQGKNKDQNQEAEMNQNGNQGKDDEPKNEKGQDGSSGSGKSNGSPKKGKSDKGDNASSGSGNGAGKSGNSGNKGGKN